MSPVKTILSPQVSAHMLGARIDSAISLVLPQAIEAIKAEMVDIKIDFDEEKTIPETGIGGSTENPHLILVWVDSSHPNVLRDVESAIQSTVVHELHHAMRNRNIPWPGTLLDDIVGEGLADYFDIEINGQHPKPWSKALTDEELVQYEEVARPRFNHQNTDDDYYKWVLGLEDDDIPRWAGYALGFKIVGEYLRNTGKKASQLVNTPSADILTL